MRERRTFIGGQFAPRRIDMLRSPAYRVLSLSARRVLDRIEIEFADHGGTDNGRLPVTYQDFADYGIDRHAIYPAIQELIALGFVELTEQGVAGGPEYRKPIKFRLTYRHAKNVMGDGSHEWMRIGEEEAPLIAAAARKSKPAKKQNQRWEKRRMSVGKPHRKREINSGISPITCRGGNPPITLDISGGEDAA
jgi:hypothetical protein